jgi:uncharacterized protein with GYD domain
MPVYIMLTKLTDEGRRTVKEKPQRILEVNKEVEEMGGKILSQYAILGDWDFINVIEAIGNTTIAKIALELGARGTIETTTMAAISVDDLVKSWK